MLLQIGTLWIVIAINVWLNVDLNLMWSLLSYQHPTIVQLYIKEDQRAKPDARKHNAQTVDSLHKVRNIMQYCIAQMLFACSAAQRCGLEPKTCCIEMMCMQAESQLEMPAQLNSA